MCSFVFLDTIRWWRGWKGKTRETTCWGKCSLQIASIMSLQNLCFVLRFNTFKKQQHINNSEEVTILEQKNKQFFYARVFLWHLSWLMCSSAFCFIFRKRIWRRSWKSKNHAGVDHPEPARKQRRTNLKNLRLWRRLRPPDCLELQPQKPLLVRLSLEISQYGCCLSQFALLWRWMIN